MATTTLRRRFIRNFTLITLGLALLFTSLGYLGVRHIVVTSRQSSDLQQAYVNAALVRSTVNDNIAALPSVLKSLDATTSSTSIVRLGSTWYVASATGGPDSLPSAIRTWRTSEVIRQVVISHDVPVLIVAVPIPSIRAVYYQQRNLGDVNGSLTRMLGVLLVASVLTICVGAYAGLRVTRRAVAPLEVTATAARRITKGDLGARLETTNLDGEVATLTEAFNEMVELLAQRLERDARFASDVSHELRSPLTTLAMTAEVLRQHSSELSPDARTALDLLTADLETFQSLVEDLLELAKSEAGADSMVVETLPCSELIQQAVMAATRRHHLPSPTLTISPAVAQARVAVDRRHMERIVTNLLENAHRYGGGHTVVTLDRLGDTLTLDVDDNGAGIPESERGRVFERFYRGSSAGARGDQRGTGLGLALVAEHVRRMNASIEVGLSPLGGARFHVTFPLAEETE